MDQSAAVNMFSALSQHTRLDVLRLLIKAGSQGVTSGELADSLGVRQNTMSTNLALLINAGLIKNERQGRSIRYYADFEAVIALLSFLLEDCCGGDPSACRPVFDKLPGWYCSS